MNTWAGPAVSLSVPAIQKLKSQKGVVSVLDSLKQIIASPEWSDLNSLIELLFRKLKEHDSVPFGDHPTLNIYLRVMKIAREEALKVKHGEHADFEENLTNRLFAVGDSGYEYVTKQELSRPVLNALEDLSIEIRSCSENMADLSLNLIHSDELIMTCGYSKYVYQFLRYAAKKGRSFKVIVCESYPDNLGHKMSDELSKCGLTTILVPDSHAFGLMSRVNKVIVNCDAVHTDGTLRAMTGIYGVMLAAKHFSVPIYVCLPQYRLSPIPFKLATNTPSFAVQPVSNPSDSSVDWLESPAVILPPSDSSLDIDIQDSSNGPVVWAPCWEYIPTGLVSLFLTNLGTHAPSYLYALGREMFHPDDIKTVLSWM